jgi:hypothetical protein
LEKEKTMQRSIFRTILGACIIGVAGISLTSGLYPMVVSLLSSMDSYQVMLMVRSFVIPVAGIWAICGGIASWQGGTATGGIIVGTCGTVTGIILGVVTVGVDPLLIIVSMLCGLIYGGIAGLIIGRAFPKPAAQP